MTYIHVKNLIQQSHKRVVISGDTVEYFEYQIPYYFNFSPQRKKIYNNLNSISKQNRRKDHIFRARQKIKRLITANQNYYGQVPKFVTFTFAENQTYLSIANKQWAIFIRKFRLYCLDVYKIKPLFLTVVEFQKRGAVHYHTIFFNVPYIPDIKQLFSDMWNNGFVQVKAVENIVHLGAYISKYLQKGVVDTRLIGRKAYFTSRGLQKPHTIRRELDVLDFMERPDTLVLSDKSHIVSQKYGIINYYLYEKYHGKN